MTSPLGSAIYLYSVFPLGIPPNADGTPTLMNLTFTLDTEPAGNYLHTSGPATVHDFQSNISVFSRGGLSDSAHSLLVNLGPNSVFLFDYYVVSRADCSSLAPCPTPSQASITGCVASLFSPCNRHLQSHLPFPPLFHSSNQRQ